MFIKVTVKCLINWEVWVTWILVSGGLFTLYGLHHTCPACLLRQVVKNISWPRNFLKFIKIPCILPSLEHAHCKSNRKEDKTPKLTATRPGIGIHLNFLWLLICCQSKGIRALTPSQATSASGPAQREMRELPGMTGVFWISKWTAVLAGEIRCRLSPSEAIGLFSLYKWHCLCLPGSSSQGLVVAS